MLGLTDFLCQVSVPFLSCSCSRVDHVCVFLFSSFEQINDEEEDDDYKIVTGGVHWKDSYTSSRELQFSSVHVLCSLNES